jgi:hypothetical protein
MAEEDGSRGRVLKLSGILAAAFFSVAASLVSWGLAVRGSWQATAALGLALGLFVAAAGQGLIWYLVHVWPPSPPAVKSEAPPAVEAPLTVEEIDRRIAALSEYRSKFDRSVFLTKSAATLMNEHGLNMSVAQKQREAVQEYLNRKLFPIATIVAQTGVCARLDMKQGAQYPAILAQAIGVLEDAREKLSTK